MTSKKEGITVSQFAEEIRVKPDRLLDQLKDAGIEIDDVDGLINEKQKEALLRYLQQNHGAKQAAASSNIVLKRATTSNVKLSSSRGSRTTVSVRRKRTYVEQASEEKTGAAVLPAEQAVASVEAPAVVEETPVVTGAEVESPVVVPGSSLPEVAVPGVVEDKAPEKAKPSLSSLKRGKHRGSEDEEGGDKQSRKKKRRTSSDGASEKNFEALLARGTDLGRVFKQVEDADDDFRRSGKFRSSSSSKVKVQAFTKPTAKMVHEVEIPENILLSDLAQLMSVKGAEVIKVLFKMGVVATINQAIDQETAILVVEEMGHTPKPVSSDAIEHRLAKTLEVAGEAVVRPPVITIMGHVDHGKTTLLDYIRTAKVAASEAGGITQHIGAYHVQTAKGTITFLDTPGHAAFTAMRARGAKLTDIVVLVVAVDDGVMPQTIEAIQHAKAAKVPIVVAVNKMDKHGVDPDRIKHELAAHELIPEEWGGETMFVPISAKVGTGVDNLLDSLLVQAEMLELKAVVDCPARGVVIESRLEHGRGAVMSVLVQQGTLRKGNVILAGFEFGRIRALYDENGRPIESAGPSIPVEVLGLSGIPQAGDDFAIVPDEKHAREVAAFRQTKHRDMKLARQAPKLEDLLQRIEDEKATSTTLNLIIKADVLGSVEALKQALLALSGTEVKVNVISSGIGGINESDANLAIASRAIVVAFNVRANTEARKLLESNKVSVHYHNIIYDVIDLVKKAISGALAPEVQERIVGLAQVREVFSSSKTGAVAGCMVVEGFVKRNLPIRVLRENVVIFEGVLESLRRFKEDASEVRNGMECGIAVKNYNDIKAGDQIEVFERIEIRREI
ncbi:MAG TPA: translation initiation factor IF-2 [Gammaproteobacteria bacterium]|nr:translation initiation factor IF-2 [Gammaproteobacteria bacterium]